MRWRRPTSGSAGTGHHPDAVLGRMTAEVLAAAMRRHRVAGADRLVQFTRTEDGFEATTSQVSGDDLPPVASLAEEQAS